MPKIGGRRKKAKSHKDETELQKELPRIFVIKRGGDCPGELQEAMHDLRRCFYPNTSMKLDDSSKVNFKTFLKASKVYNVTHVVALQHAKNKNFLRIVKLGGGEMTFRIINYCCMRDVLHNGGQPFSLSFKDPLTVLNGFGGNSQTKMIGRALQEMFPPINPQKIKVERLKRVVCFDYNSNKKMIYFRHYKIIIQEGGIDKSFSKLLEQKNLDLSRFSSIGEYLKSLNQGEEEKGENQQKVKLVEMGPRFKLKFLNFKEKSGYVEEEEGEEEGEEPGPQNAEVADDDEQQK